MSSGMWRIWAFIIGVRTNESAFASFHSYLSLGFKRVLALGVLGLTVLVLPLRFAFH